MLKKLYYKLPISAGLRYRLGQYKRKLLRRTISASALAGAAPSVLPEAPGLASQRRIAAAQTGARDYFFFGVIDWHFRHQRPQQLALSIAQSGRRVFYVSVNFCDHAEPGFELEKLDAQLALYQVFFFLPGAQSIYAQPPSEAQLQQLREGLLKLWDCAGTQWAVHVVQHPYWFRLAGFVPGARLIYDCMDFHAGFSNTGQAHEGVEQQLIKLADLTIVTSDFLAKYASQSGAKQLAMIRNAAEFEHFYPAAVAPQGKARKQPVIGYYGAIAEWFDSDLLLALAAHLPQCQIQLIGDDSAGVAKRLSELPNIEFFGEKPYAELPKWLAGFDVCLIPFKVNALTLATNPVKVYEFLSAGKPVVGTDLPELAQFGDLVYRASDSAAFLRQVRRALDEPQQDTAQQLRANRIDFARQQTWHQRAHDLLGQVELGLREPSASVVLVSYGQWHLTQRCLDSLHAQSDQPDLEVIVVDNASGAAAAAALRAWAQQDVAHRRIVLNSENRGFAPAVNQGLALATGDYLVILNNDIVVGPGWLRGLRRHLEADAGLGLLCPVTNNIGNEARIVLAGTTLPEVFCQARSYALARSGQLLPLAIAAFFCVMLPRRVYQAVGSLDEQFVPGFFEDDDYCLRVKQQGWRIGCAEDVFVYHELSASFDQLASVRRQAIFDRNKALFEKKWGPWTAHVYRPESPGT